MEKKISLKSSYEGPRKQRIRKHDHKSHSNVAQTTTVNMLALQTKIAQEIGRKEDKSEGQNERRR